MYFKQQSIEASGVQVIDTMQKKVGRVNLPKSQKELQFFAIINESKDSTPSVTLSSGQTKDASKPGAYVYQFTAKNTASAKVKAVKEARKRYIRYHQLSSSTSNIWINVESTIQENLHIHRKKR